MLAAWAIQSSLDWDQIYGCFNQLKQELRDNFPYQVTHLFFPRVPPLQYSFHFQQIFVFKADSHQILKLVLFLCFNMKILSSENVYLFIMTVGCWMQFTCVDV